MARVTVEDCLDHVLNRFALVHIGTQRAKQLRKGVHPKIECDNREIVTALREIADGQVEFDASQAESLTHGSNDETNNNS